MEKNFKPSPNSFKNTFCVFKEVDIERTKNLKLQFKSKAGSSYYYTTEGMYRVSNHWGRLANSKWRLAPAEMESGSKTKVGFATWDDFYPDSPDETWYYIQADYQNNTANYQHRNNPEYDKKAILRTSFDTTKRLKQIRNLQQLTSWAKYFDYDDIDDLRKKIIEKLIYTNLPLDVIKYEFIKV